MKYVPVEFDRSVLGKEFDHVVHPPVTAEDIVAYARSYGETNPLYTDAEAARCGPYGGLVAPPTYPFRLRMRHEAPRTMPVITGNGIDAGKDVEFGEAVRPGDVLTTSTVIHDIYEKTGRSGTMNFLVIRTMVTNQDGKMVAIIDQRVMFR